MIDVVTAAIVPQGSLEQLAAAFAFGGSHSGTIVLSNPMLGFCTVHEAVAPDP